MWSIAGSRDGGIILFGHVCDMVNGHAKVYKISILFEKITLASLSSHVALHIPCAYACSACPIPPSLVHCIPTSGFKEEGGR